MPELPSNPREILPIPISAAEDIAKSFGYDQVVVMARRVGDPPDTHGEHITTYGINTVHCDVAAQMGASLKVLMQWPEKADMDKARDLFDELEYSERKNDGTDPRVAALGRLLYPRGKR